MGAGASALFPASAGRTKTWILAKKFTVLPGILALALEAPGFTDKLTSQSRIRRQNIRANP
jgi:hypothetical protein